MKRYVPTLVVLLLRCRGRIAWRSAAAVRRSGGGACRHRQGLLIIGRLAAGALVAGALKSAPLSLLQNGSAN